MRGLFLKLKKGVGTLKKLKEYKLTFSIRIKIFSGDYIESDLIFLDLSNFKKITPLMVINEKALINFSLEGEEFLRFG